MDVTASSRLGRLPLYLDLIRCDRPAGTLLLLWPTLSALWIAADGFPGWHLLIVFVLGPLLMRSAGCAANDVADRDFDRHVKRTANRPVTSGAIGVGEALTLAAALAGVAFALAVTTNLAAVAWSVVALAVTLVYPFSKRFFAMPQAILGIAFSFGIPMAFAAVRGGDSWSPAALAGAVPPLAWWLLYGNLFWVLAYDTEYAMVDRDDDLRIGIKTSAITLGRFDVAAVMAFYAAYFAIWALIGRTLGYAGRNSGIAVAALDRLLALHPDPRTHARRVLSRLSPQPLARLRALHRSRRPARAALTSARGSAARLERGQRRGQRGDCQVDVLALDDQRRRESDHGAVRVLAQHAAREQAVADLARAGEGRIDLDADEQALAAHFGDRRMVERAQLGEQLVAADARLLGQALLLQQIERGRADRCGECVAAEGAAVVAGREYRHHLLGGEERAHRQQAAAERLAESEAVGTMPS
jgi:4-hydroxybenzoate polyprenyltransferase